MWAVIKQQDLPYLELNYPELAEYKDVDNPDSDPLYVLYTTDTGLCFLPKFFKDQFPCESIGYYEDTSFEAQQIDIVFTGNLRDNQKPFITAASKVNAVNISGILQGYPGIGKTVIAAKLAADYGQKTMIILDNSKLVEQWIEAFVKFTSITEDDIGIIKGAKMEVDKPIVIAMVQTLVSKAKRGLKVAYQKIRDAGFGTIIIDECHKSQSAPMFSKASLFFNTPNIIGLSATPYNQDLAKVLMHGVIGEVLYKSQSYELIPDIYFIEYNSNLAQKQLHRVSYARDMIGKTATYNSIIVESQQYVFMISKLVQKLLASDHQTFIICSTIKQVEKIKDRLDSIGVDNDILHGKKPKIDKKAKVIIATYSFAGAGFDLKTLSALIYAAPYKGKKSTIQTIGRILRKSEGKEKAIVFDLVDVACPTVFDGYIRSKSKILMEEFKTCNIKTLQV